MTTLNFILFGGKKMPAQERSLTISWNQFEACNPNTQDAFENMCRFLFNAFFFGGRAIFQSNPNNPGIEIEPVFHKNSGKRISFQAKYFTTVDYSQIRHSAEKAVRYYAGKMDIIYLYCNRDLTLSSKAYQDICDLLTFNNISLVPITNQAILEQVLNNNTVSWYYFDYRNLTPKWFDEKLQLSLDALGRRYDGTFNISTHTEKSLNLFLCNNCAVTQINAAKNEVLEQLKNSQYNYSDCRESIQRIINAVSSLRDVSRATISGCLSWPEIFHERCAADFALIRTLLEEKRKIYASEEETDANTLRHRLLKEIRDLQWLIEIIDNFNVNIMGCNLLQEKVLIVRGEAGVGKSQLLATAAKQINVEGQYAILLLGNGFLSAETVTTQIMQQLDADFNFQVLLHKLEMLGKLENCNTYILIDAINETPYREIWKTGLPLLISQIREFEHIKLVVSVRSGYERLVFNETVNEGIETNNIASIVHSGFREESVEATLAFLNHYGIPFLPSYFFQAEMTNPLFLKLFCQYYTGESFDMFTLFDQLVQRADTEAQRAAGITDCMPILQNMVEELAEIRLEKANWTVTRNELFNLRFWGTYGLSANKIHYIAALSKVGFLNNFARDDEEFYYLSYNLLEDFVCAKAIFRRYRDKSALISYVQDGLLQIEHGQINCYANIDIFIVLCSLYAECYHEECFVDIFSVITDMGDQDDLSDRYIKSFLWRKATAINRSAFITFVNEYAVSKESVLRVLIENSAKENHPLNAFFLHDILKNKSLAQRDYLWTTYINGLAHREERLFQIITYFDEGKALNGLSEISTKLLLILFSWLLTSSNRLLRDKASKAAIELLKRNFSLCKSLLHRFEKVNDPYVLQRLYGIVFGACVKRSEPAINTYRELAEYVYSTIFDQDTVYPDILLRDYARLILERWIYEVPDDCVFLNIAKIRPPYRSEEIPHVEEQEYYNEKEAHSGFNSVVFSMRINHPGCPGMYGDFGRYVFQAALEKFEAIDLVNLYHYAMQYIRDTLGYSDQLFSEYERIRTWRNYSRHENKKIERIGKKYQWIALHNILARVSDTHMLKDWDGASHLYEGTWEPYVRDFDPTLNINFLKPDFIPSIQFPPSNERMFLQASPFPSEESIQKWTVEPTTFFKNFPDKLILVDKDGTQWVSLNFYDELTNQEFKSHGLYASSGKQIIWLMAQGYLVDSETLELLKQNYTPGLFGNDLPQGLRVYQLFNREYSWSPGYHSIFQTGQFETEIKIGEKTLIRKLAEMPVLVQREDGDIEFEVTEREIEQLVYSDAVCVKITPAYSHLLWEEEYDASQQDTTAFDVPCREIIDYLHLEQREYDGYYFDSEGVLVCFDGSLCGINSGLLIRKEYLERFLSGTELKLFWLCMGEKQFFLGGNNQIWKRWEGCAYYDQGQISGKLEPEGVS